MKFNLKKKLVFLGIMFLLIGIVYSSNTLDKIKMEKTQDGYEIYELREKYTEQDISIKEKQLTQENKLLQNLLENLEEDCSYCDFETKEGYWKSNKDCIFVCQKEGSYLTVGERDSIERKIKYNNLELNELYEIKKIK